LPLIIKTITKEMFQNHQFYILGLKNNLEYALY
jgi:hypothetical protein